MGIGDFNMHVRNGNCTKYLVGVNNCLRGKEIPMN